MIKKKIIDEKKCAAGKTFQTKCPTGQIFWLSPDGFSGFVLLICQWYEIYFLQSTAQIIIVLINELIDQLIH